MHLYKLISIRRLSRVCRDNGLLVLTYDDGPGASLTPRLLELLASQEASATFFVLGRRVAGREAVIDRILREGHEVGCHGQNHLNAWRTLPWRAVEDIDAGYRTLAPWLSLDATFRPPHGKSTLATWWRLNRRGARLSWWTIDSGDTHPTLPDPERIVEDVANKHGGVVLMHDFDREIDQSQRAEFVFRTTDLLLRAARREGLKVCRYRDLLAYNWARYRRTAAPADTPAREAT